MAAVMNIISPAQAPPWQARETLPPAIGLPSPVSLAAVPAVQCMTVVWLHHEDNRRRNCPGFLTQRGSRGCGEEAQERPRLPPQAGYAGPVEHVMQCRE